MTAFACQAIAKRLSLGGRKSGVMEAVTRAPRTPMVMHSQSASCREDKKELSDCVDVGIVTGMDNARNNINILSSDVVIACGYGGSGTASEIALALKSGKPVILLNERRECIDFFRAIGGKLLHASNSVNDTISHVKKLLEKR